MARLGELMLYLTSYLLIFLMLLIFARNRKIRILLIPAFFIGLLFVPPFQFIEHVSFHYIKPVNNFPPGKTIEAVQLLGDSFLTRNNGEPIYFPTIFGGNYDYWKVLKNDAPVIIEEDNEEVVSITIYDKKRPYVLSQAHAQQFGRDKFIVPIFAHEFPEYRELALTGKTLEEN